ncbi:MULTISPECIES: sensor domain-containing diguanylate cyclase [unclassified Sphingobium]|uniref:sensor domain-containing diguanylate cyclase n=1 Tax=unclassified Sphingobium TaxID=2611147 RepID=UPI000D159B11|nr:MULTISPECIES: sensor domain-containing diguanylate cyclase [unclassified Sphingobium]MBG6117697.1 diguanylate cyclase (GGDEF)-like protein [Sphingobium sp. JAI105]PSO12768.1 sensor domain-containing diguanylate cyclase [Sphingobium sp. AEW4]TWD09967.1 diguanylate cyclase with GAF sensor [Sphingobium sp. AEW010]TWD26638.1 diguanylate cyclase with GAF sensor [Sphingobium sp. AEW013]TWD27593.1 diguanylate cyclase with GAF sensor [Sphingobium sp. AEW001]
MKHRQLPDEEGRLSALGRYQILDTASETAFDKITGLVRDILDVPICAVSLVDGERQWFKSIQGLDATETSRSVAFCAHTILKRTPMVDAELDPRFASNPLVTGNPRIRSYAGVPLQSPDGYNLGSLCVIDVQPRNFSEGQISILDKFAELIINELELRTLAHRDSLIDAVTRRSFIEAVEKAISRLEQDSWPCALILFDLDHFKKINGGYGHPAGDEVLIAIANCCRTTIRPADILGRLGGEEFGVLLNETSFKDAVLVAERLRNQFSRLAFDWAPHLKITASFGVSEIAPGQSLDHWIGVTDAALFKAKHGGRNRTIGSSKLVSCAVAA